MVSHTLKMRELLPLLMFHITFPGRWFITNFSSSAGMQPGKHVRHAWGFNNVLYETLSFLAIFQISEFCSSPSSRYQNNLTLHPNWCGGWGAFLILCKKNCNFSITEHLMNLRSVFNFECVCFGPVEKKTQSAI